MGKPRFPLPDTLPSVTVRTVMSWRPCYTRAQVRRLFAGRETVNALDVLDMEIPDIDKTWALRQDDLLPRGIAHAACCDIATAAMGKLARGGVHVDESLRSAIRVQRAWLRGAEVDKARLFYMGQEAIRMARNVYAPRSASSAAAWDVAFALGCGPYVNPESRAAFFAAVRKAIRKAYPAVAAG